MFGEITNLPINKIVVAIATEEEVAQIFVKDKTSSSSSDQAQTGKTKIGRERMGELTLKSRQVRAIYDTRDESRVAVMRRPEK